MVSLSLTLGLLTLLWAIGSAMAQGPQPEADVQPQDGVSIAATVNSRINFQGELKESGVPVTGNRDMIFRLYSNSSCTTQVGSNIPVGAVPVTDGRFSVQLDVDHHAFNGQGLWLRVQVETTQLGCQEIVPVPYALSLRPGALISGAASGSNFGEAVVNIDNLVPSWQNYPALYVRTATGSAVRGESGGVGVYGSSTTTYAVRGESTNGTAGYFNSQGGYGVWANTTGIHHWDHGGFFISQSGNGVYARSENNYGLVAKGDTMGGVRGQTNSGTGVGGSSSSGTAVMGTSSTGTAFYGASGSGDLMKLYDYSPFDLRFHVKNSGEVRADGSYYSGTGGYITGSADFAEMVPPGQPGLTPGDVLAIGLDGQMVRCSEPGQTTVVGVYSTDPGFVGGYKMDEDGNPLEPERIPLAIAGIVPVKASAENGSIQPGDMLVASSTPGHAMRADPNPSVGTVIGKALGNLDEDLGTVTVLVMLQ